MALHKRERLLAILVALCLGIFCLDRFVITPLVDSWKSHTAEIQTLTAERDQYTSLLEKKKRFDAHMRHIEKHSLSNNQSEAENTVISQLSSWATDAGISLTSVRPALRSERDQQYPTMRFRLTANGTLSSLTKFLYSIEKAAMPLRTKQLDIASRKANGTNLDVDLEVEAVLRAVSSEEGGA